MSKLTEEEVKHVAKLARIELKEDEVEKYAEQLSSILQYVDKLNEVDTSKVKPTAQVTNLKSVLRKDEVKPSLSQEEALSTAVKKENGYFQTQAVIK
jgi:aspartyl-tRNA(Asn)/glutamyl-tRNA(Gln) amidotransferase subunit C